MPGAHADFIHTTVIRMTQADPTAAPPRVSVIVPFLDTPLPFFREAVESVFAQGFGDWELLLVNDGSGAEATRFAEALASEHPARLRILTHPGGRNRGVAASRTLGLEHSRGELIACLDSDDVWHPEKLEEQVRILDSSPHVDMIFGRSLYWHSWSDDSREADHVHPLGVPDRTEMGQGEFLLRFLRYQVIVPIPSSILVRRDAVVRAGGFGDLLSIYEDQAFYAKLSFVGVVMACEEIWNRYRVHPQSSCQSSSRAQKRAARRGFLRWLSQELDRMDAGSPALRRTVRIEHRATALPRGPQVIRLLRQLTN